LLASTIIAGTVAAMAAAGSAAAQTATPATATPPAATAPQEIIVTGSLIRRLNTETPSPIQVITSTDLKNSGYTSLAEVLTNITANGAGMLSANNSEAFAGGASGIALRGLSAGESLQVNEVF
jgi:iron complex outermembrane receptor protein